MVWGMVLSSGLGAVNIVDGKFDQYAYKNLMKNFAIQLINLKFQSYSLVQDNCPVHQAKSVTNYFAETPLMLLNGQRILLI